MSAKIKMPAWCIAPLLSISAIASLASDARLAEAVQNLNKPVMRSLLQQHAEVNAPQADGSTALHWAVDWNDMDVVDALLRAGANVNAATDYGVTPISLACNSGNAAIVDRLLKAGANAKSAMETGETALMTCARTGSVEGVKLLLARGAEVDAQGKQRGQTALMFAVAEKHPEITRVLIERGANVRAVSKGGFTPLLFAARSGDLDSAKLLVAAGANVNDAANNESALLVAAASGHEPLALFLLEKGADPNAADEHGLTPLHYAFQKEITAFRHININTDDSRRYFLRPDMLQLAKALLEHGANPNAKIEKEPRLWGPLMGSEAPIYLGSATPFMLAASAGNVEFMRLLLAKGADPMAMTTGSREANTEAGTTALMLAASLGGSPMIPVTPESEKNALEALKFMVELGGDINAMDAAGQNALHYACYRGVNSIVQYLVDHGADVNQKDNYGQTPLSIALLIVPDGLTDRGKHAYRVNKSTADLLRKLGAKEFTPEPNVASVSPAK